MYRILLNSFSFIKQISMRVTQDNVSKDAKLPCDF